MIKVLKLRSRDPHHSHMPINRPLLDIWTWASPISLALFVPQAEVFGVLISRCANHTGLKNVLYRVFFSYSRGRDFKAH